MPGGTSFGHEGKEGRIPPVIPHARRKKKVGTLFLPITEQIARAVLSNYVPS